MLRQVIWSKSASQQLLDTLKFWNEDNGSTAYSDKLYNSLNKSISLVLKYPEIGRMTTISSVKRILVEEKYGLYYSFDDEILLILYWKSLAMDPESNIYE